MKLVISLLSGLATGLVVWGTLHIKLGRLHRYEDETAQVYDNMFFILIALATFSFVSFLIYLLLIYI
jgi:hypothetical protein